MVLADPELSKAKDALEVRSLRGGGGGGAGFRGSLKGSLKGSFKGSIIRVTIKGLRGLG